MHPTADTTTLMLKLSSQPRVYCRFNCLSSSAAS